MNVGYASDFAKHMPPWNHDPEKYHKPDGDVWHITGLWAIDEVLKEGVGLKLIEELVRRTRETPGISSVATTYNLRHPVVRNPHKIWGRFGFKPIPFTYDPYWNHDGELHPKGAPDDGSIVWAIVTKVTS